MLPYKIYTYGGTHITSDNFPAQKISFKNSVAPHPFQQESQSHTTYSCWFELDFKLVWVGSFCLHYRFRNSRYRCKEGT